ncbi:rhamnogalacturonan lyase [Saccharicrinis sp. FJH2]|uniref:rhamnogalacturonan lyase n=1 Tax=Saccharicrinis sp. FJH65 TaxID=3344659 RepID=UPI0035F27411
MLKHTILFSLLILSQGLLFNLNAQRHLERLDRGMVAIPAGKDSVFISWRLLNSDPEQATFNLYRDGKLLNTKPLSVTNFTDDKATDDAQYVLRPIQDKKETDESSTCKPWDKPYWEIPLQTPYRYSPNDASVADLDGDGQYELVIHMTGRGHDNSHLGLTSDPIFQAYEMDGTLLWTINLGKNIREGAHYTQFMVYDLDGDGKAEIAMKTADGTTDGTGNVIGDPDADWVDRNAQSRTFGKIVTGPEYFTIFEGATGKELATTDYVPGRGNLGGWGGIGGNGQNDYTANRADRFLAAVAYLDGKLPSVIMCRGYYGRSVLAAWDWRDGKLSQRWVFDSSKPGLELFSGQGNHNINVADVDNDGKDEIIYGAMVVDDNGTGIFSTGLRHGDALYVGDLVPQRPGMEVWGPHENEEPVKGYENGYGEALYDALTGEIIWGKNPGWDVGRACAADIDPRYEGFEFWTNVDGLFDAKGNDIGPKPRSTNFVIWWDGDLLRELLDRNRITKWDWEQNKEKILLQDYECNSNNGSKATPVLSADLFGDWREEVIWRTRDNQKIRIYSTTYPTDYRYVTLMQDPQYRLSIAWQNVGYNQPPNTGFYIGESTFPKQ